MSRIITHLTSFTTLCIYRHLPGSSCCQAVAETSAIFCDGPAENKESEFQKRMEVLRELRRVGRPTRQNVYLLFITQPMIFYSLTLPSPQSTFN